MSIQFSCHSCSSVLKAKNEHVGRQLQCPKCQAVLTVPAEEAPPEPKPLVDASPFSSMSSPAASSPVADAPNFAGINTGESSPAPAAPDFGSLGAGQAAASPSFDPRSGAGITPGNSGTINAMDYVAPGTKKASTIGWLLFWLIGPVFVIGSVISTFGAALIGWLIGWLIAWIVYRMKIKRTEAFLQGSGIQVSASQFPEIHQTVVRLAEQLRLPEMPNVYVIESNEQNAFAMKTGRKQNIILIDDIVHGSYSTGNQHTLDFIIGHELAHHALGHTGLLRGIVSSTYKPLARLDEFSADAVSNAMLQDREAALSAMTLLAVGPQLYTRVNRDALKQQVDRVMKNKYSKKVETTLSHPLLMRRYGALCGMKI